MRLLFTLSVLFFTQLFLNLAHASPQTKVAADQRKSHVSQAKPDERRKRKTVARTSKKSKSEPVKEQKAKVKETKKVTSTKLVRNEHSEKKTAKATHSKVTTKKESRTIAKNETSKKAYGRHRKSKDGLAKDTKPIALSAAHKKRYQHAQQTAMTKLMHQVGKPYRWGGTSPNTGFDCSGLVYYAYKDLIRIKMPRTANEMYHLRDAAPVKRGELESGDLVFFRINNRGAADHVGVYVGNGKFIQSPRTGEEIKITSLGEDYWQDHYVGARRVMTPKTIR